MKYNDRIQNYRFGRITIFLVIAACLYVLAEKPELLELHEHSTEYRDQLAQKMDRLSLQYFIDTNVKGECTLVIMQNGEPQALTEYEETSDLACKRLLPYIKAPTSKPVSDNSTFADEEQLDIPVEN
ncbi:hypothetical protein [Litoribrevibacter albus]|uniref:Uncharacterized protein n=1 Tax=Litoribrevibacter albus TaxID=1473156 RepID=A0AA37SDP0_9GAMM|nr:hypothetical protein [Litoribrevibacter albus]GLQ33534.1 hypothetical protein GCM10007876_40140 [Litoribrevibacter albus]